MCTVLLQPLEVDIPVCWIGLVPPVVFFTKCHHSLVPMFEGESPATDMEIWHINGRNPVIPEDPLLQQIAELSFGEHKYRTT